MVTSRVMGCAGYPLLCAPGIVEFTESRADLAVARADPAVVGFDDRTRD
jgi:hypothetical protein